ncbi:hypothetical protein NQZ79_g7251 [Umbelopsis isabellina]|nr:hypothetical protein NQZ79_g7251 [Umbelopsis isabellina]
MRVTHTGTKVESGFIPAAMKAKADCEGERDSDVVLVDLNSGLGDTLDRGLWPRGEEGMAVRHTSEHSGLFFMHRAVGKPITQKAKTREEPSARR